MFLVYLGVILGYIVSKEGKLPNPNNIWIIVNMPPQLKTPCNIHVFKGPCSLLLMFNWTFCFHFEANHKVDAKIWSFKVDYQINANFKKRKSTSTLKSWTKQFLNHLFFLIRELLILWLKISFKTWKVLKEGFY
jgi:hypothetical protein